MSQVSPSLNIQRLYEIFKDLGWEVGDELLIEIGGTVTSGINQPDGYNERWSLQKGNHKFNKDAFIIIKNSNRNPVVSSLSKPQQDELTDDKLNYDTSGK